ncbi:S8 family serine peptidase, partial [Elusimicrobiota bacterium]
TILPQLKRGTGEAPKIQKTDPGQSQTSGADAKTSANAPKGSTNPMIKMFEGAKQRVTSFIGFRSKGDETSSIASGLPAALSGLPSSIRESFNKLSIPKKFAVATPLAIGGLALAAYLAPSLGAGSLGLATVPLLGIVKKRVTSKTDRKKKKSKKGTPKKKKTNKATKKSEEESESSADSAPESQSNVIPGEISGQSTEGLETYEMPPSSGRSLNDDIERGPAGEFENNRGGDNTDGSDPDGSGSYDGPQFFGIAPAVLGLGAISSGDPVITILGLVAAGGLGLYLARNKIKDFFTSKPTLNGYQAWGNIEGVHPQETARMQIDAAKTKDLKTEKPESTDTTAPESVKNLPMIKDMSAKDKKAYQRGRKDAKKAVAGLTGDDIGQGILDMVNNTKKGDSITVLNFTFTDEKLYNAIEAAYNRDVKVVMYLDQQLAGKAPSRYPQLKKLLGDNVHLRNGKGNRGIMHIKYWRIHSKDTGEDAIMFGSANASWSGSWGRNAEAMIKIDPSMLDNAYGRGTFKVLVETIKKFENQIAGMRDGSKARQYPVSMLNNDEARNFLENHRGEKIAVFNSVEAVEITDELIAEFDSGEFTSLISAQLAGKNQQVVLVGLPSKGPNGNWSIRKSNRNNLQAHKPWGLLAFKLGAFDFALRFGKDYGISFASSVIDGAKKLFSWFGAKLGGNKAPPNAGMTNIETLEFLFDTLLAGIVVVGSAAALSFGITTGQYHFVIGGAIGALLMALTLHEVAHGAVAKYFGDDTAYEAGRLTLNPFKHLSASGILAMIIFKFGWLKPVPLHPNLDQYPKAFRSVAVAGIATNLVLGAITLPIAAFIPVAAPFLTIFAFYNLMFAAFNMLPIAFDLTWKQEIVEEGTGDIYETVKGYSAKSDGFQLLESYFPDTLSTDKWWQKLAWGFGSYGMIKGFLAFVYPWVVSTFFPGGLFDLFATPGTTTAMAMGVGALGFMGSSKIRGALAGGLKKVADAISGKKKEEAAANEDPAKESAIITPSGIIAPPKDFSELSLPISGDDGIQAINKAILDGQAQFMIMPTEKIVSAADKQALDQIRAAVRVSNLFVYKAADGTISLFDKSKLERTTFETVNDGIGAAIDIASSKEERANLEAMIKSLDYFEEEEGVTSLKRFAEWRIQKLQAWQSLVDRAEYMLEKGFSRKDIIEKMAGEGSDAFDLIFGPMIRQEMHLQERMKQVLKYMKTDPKYKDLAPHAMEALKVLEMVTPDGMLPVRFGATPNGALAYFHNMRFFIVVDFDLANASIEYTASILAHELTHAYDNLKGRPFAMQSEGRAFMIMALIAENFKSSDLPDDNYVDWALKSQVLNIRDLWRKYGRDPEIFFSKVTQRHGYWDSRGSRYAGLMPSEHMLHMEEKQLKEKELALGKVREKLSKQKAILASATDVNAVTSAEKAISILEEKEDFIIREVVYSKNLVADLAKTIAKQKELWVGKGTAEEIGEASHMVDKGLASLETLSGFFKKNFEIANFNKEQKISLAWKMLRMILVSPLPYNLAAIVQIPGIQHEKVTSERRFDAENALRGKVLTTKLPVIAFTLNNQMVQGGWNGLTFNRSVTLGAYPEFRKSLWQYGNEMQSKGQDFIMKKSPQDESGISVFNTFKLQLLRFWREDKHIQEYIDANKPVLQQILLGAADPATLGERSMMQFAALADHPVISQVAWKLFSPMLDTTATMGKFMQEIEQALQEQGEQVPEEQVTAMTQQAEMTAQIARIQSLATLSMSFASPEVNVKLKDAIKEGYLKALNDESFFEALAGLMQQDQMGFISNMKKLGQLSADAEVRKELWSKFKKDPATPIEKMTNEMALTLINGKSADAALDKEIADTVFGMIVKQKAAPLIFMLGNLKPQDANIIEFIKNATSMGSSKVVSAIFGKPKNSLLDMLSWKALSNYIDKPDVQEMFMRGMISPAIDIGIRNFIAETVFANMQTDARLRDMADRYQIFILHAHQRELGKITDWTSSMQGMSDQKLIESSYLAYMSHILATVARDTINNSSTEPGAIMVTPNGMIPMLTSVFPAAPGKATSAKTAPQNKKAKRAGPAKSAKKSGAKADTEKNTKNRTALYYLKWFFLVGLSLDLLAWPFVENIPMLGLGVQIGATVVMVAAAIGFFVDFFILYLPRILPQALVPFILGMMAGAYGGSVSTGIGAGLGFLAALELGKWGIAKIRSKYFDAGDEINKKDEALAEQFQAFLNKEVEAGRLDEDLREQIEPYFATPWNFKFKLVDMETKTIYIRPQLMARTQHFYRLLEHARVQLDQKTATGMIQKTWQALRLNTKNEWKSLKAYWKFKDAAIFHTFVLLMSGLASMLPHYLLAKILPGINSANMADQLEAMSKLPIWANIIVSMLPLVAFYATHSLLHFKNPIKPLIELKDKARPKLKQVIDWITKKEKGKKPGNDGFINPSLLFTFGGFSIAAVASLVLLPAAYVVAVPFIALTGGAVGLFTGSKLEPLNVKRTGKDVSGLAWVMPFRSILFESAKSPDGKSEAQVIWRNYGFRVHVNGKALPGKYSSVEHITFSPDGKRIAFTAATFMLKGPKNAALVLDGKKLVSGMHDISKPIFTSDGELVYQIQKEWNSAPEWVSTDKTKVFTDLSPEGIPSSDLPAEITLDRSEKATEEKTETAQAGGAWDPIAHIDAEDMHRFRLYRPGNDPGVNKDKNAPADALSFPEPTIYFAKALDKAKELAKKPKLISANAELLNKSQVWTYTFYSIEDNQEVKVSVNFVGRINNSEQRATTAMPLGMKFINLSDIKFLLKDALERLAEMGFSPEKVSLQQVIYPDSVLNYIFTDKQGEALRLSTQDGSIQDLKKAVASIKGSADITTLITVGILALAAAFAAMPLAAALSSVAVISVLIGIALGAISGLAIRAIYGIRKGEASSPTSLVRLVVNIGLFAGIGALLGALAALALPYIGATTVATIPGFIALGILSSTSKQTWSGRYGTKHPSGEFIIRNKKEWEDMWAKLNKPAPKVDFSKQMAVAVFSSPKNTGGYSINIDNVQAGQDRINVYYSERAPPANTMTPQVITKPYAITLVKASPKPVKFFRSINNLTFTPGGDVAYMAKQGGKNVLVVNGKALETRVVTVERTVDGDTLKLNGGERVRFLGVDTPELHHPSKPVGYYAQEAYEFTRDLTEGQEITLAFDEANIKNGHKDKYGRTLAYIILPSGEMLNRRLLSEGYAFVYTKFPYKYKQEFIALEKQARKDKVGMWAPREDEEDLSLDQIYSKRKFQHRIAKLKVLAFELQEKITGMSISMPDFSIKTLAKIGVAAVTVAFLAIPTAGVFPAVAATSVSAGVLFGGIAGLAVGAFVGMWKGQGAGVAGFFMMGGYALLYGTFGALIGALVPFALPLIAAKPAEAALPISLFFLMGLMNKNDSAPALYIGKIGPDYRHFSFVPDEGVKIPVTMTRLFNQDLHPELYAQSPEGDLARQKLAKILTDSGLPVGKLLQTHGIIKSILSHEDGNRIVIAVPQKHAGIAQKLLGANLTYTGGGFKQMLDGARPMLGVNKLFESGETGKGVDLAIQDNGVDPNHPDLQGPDGKPRIEEIDLFGDGASKNPDHGTHTSSTMIGDGTASDGKFRGVLPEATAVMFKVFPAAGTLFQFLFGFINNSYHDDLLIGMLEAKKMARLTTNMSLGAPYGSAQGEKDFSEYGERGMMVVASAGNSGPRDKSGGYPGAYRDVLAVGSETKDGFISHFSSLGPAKSPSSGAHVLKPNVLGVGGDAWKIANYLGYYKKGLIAARNTNATEAPNHDVVYIDGKPLYTKMAGTSMSAPEITALAGLMDKLAKDKGMMLTAREKIFLIMFVSQDRGYMIDIQGAGIPNNFSTGKYLAEQYLNDKAAGNGLYQKYMQFDEVFHLSQPMGNYEKDPTKLLPYLESGNWLTRFYAIHGFKNHPLRAGPVLNALLAHLEKETDSRNKRMIYETFTYQTDFGAKQAILAHVRKEQKEILNTISQSQKNSAGPLLDESVSSRQVQDDTQNKIQDSATEKLLLINYVIARMDKNDAASRQYILDAVKNTQDRIVKLNAIWIAGHSFPQDSKLAEILKELAMDKDGFHEIRAYAFEAIDNISIETKVPSKLIKVLPAKFVASLIDEFADPDRIAFLKPLMSILNNLLLRKGNNDAKKLYMADNDFKESVVKFLEKYGKQLDGLQTHKKFLGIFLILANIANQMGIDLKQFAPEPVKNDPDDKSDSKPSDSGDGTQKPPADNNKEDTVDLIVSPPKGIKIQKFEDMSKSALSMMSAELKLDFTDVEMMGAVVLAYLPMSRKITMRVPSVNVKRIQKKLKKQGMNSKVAEKVEAFINETGPMSGTEKIHVDGATGKNIIFLVVDEGGDPNHPAFKDKVFAARNFTRDGKKDDTSKEGIGHGTHVGGIMTGKAVGEYEGMAPDAKIFFAKVLGANGGSMASVMAGLEWGINEYLTGTYKDKDGTEKRYVDNFALVGNMSLGGPGNADSDLSKLVDRIADEHGIKISIAAGNSGKRSKMGSPASSKRGMTITSAIKDPNAKGNDKVAFYSTPGPAYDSQGNVIGNQPAWIDYGGDAKSGAVCRFKDGIAAAMNTKLKKNSCTVIHTTPDGEEIKLQKMSGTSMAAPHAGAKYGLLLDVAIEAFKFIGKNPFPMNRELEDKVLAIMLAALREKGQWPGMEARFLGAGLPTADPMHYAADIIRSEIIKHGDLPVQFLRNNDKIIVSSKELKNLKSGDISSVIGEKIVVPMPDTKTITLTDGKETLKVDLRSTQYQHAKLVSKWVLPNLMGAKAVEELQKKNGEAFTTLFNFAVPGDGTENAAEKVKKPSKWIANLKAAGILSLINLFAASIGYLTGDLAGMFTGILTAAPLSLLMYLFSHKIALLVMKAKPATEKELPQVYKALGEIVAKTGTPMPKVYRIKSKGPNAMATGPWPAKGCVAVTDGLLELMDYEELKGVLAHEISHVNHFDTLVNTLGAIISNPLSAISSQYSKVEFPKSVMDHVWKFALTSMLVLIGPMANIVGLLAITRSREYMADHGAAHILDDPKPLIRALAKLETGNRLAVSTEGMMLLGNLMTINPTVGFGQRVFQIFSSHPLTQLRIKKLASLIENKDPKSKEEHENIIGPQPRPIDVNVAGAKEAPGLLDAKKSPFVKGALFTTVLLGWAGAVAAGATLPAWAISVIGGVALSLLGMYLWDVTAYGLVMVLGPKLSDAEFEQALQSYVQRGSITQEFANKIKPYRGQWWNFALGATDKDTIWIRPQVFAWPQQFGITMSNLMVHYKAKRGPPVIRRIITEAKALIKEYKAATMSRTPKDLNPPKTWLTIMLAKTVKALKKIPVPLIAGPAALATGYFIAPVVGFTLGAGLLALPFAIGIASWQPEVPVIDYLEANLQSDNFLTRKMTAESVFRLSKSVYAPIKEPLKELIAASIDLEANPDIKVQLEKALKNIKASEEEQITPESPRAPPQDEATLAENTEESASELPVEIISALKAKPQVPKTKKKLPKGTWALLLGNALGYAGNHFYYNFFPFYMNTLMSAPNAAGKAKSYDRGVDTAFTLPSGYVA